MAPEYLRAYCIGVSSSRSGPSLRSEARGDLKVRKSKTCFRDRAYNVAGPRCWNNLPPSIRSATSLESFKSRLKTHDFKLAYTLTEFCIVTQDTLFQVGVYPT